MNAPASNVAIAAETGSLRRWLLAFFIPTYSFAAMCLLMALGLAESQDGPGGLLMVVLGIASGASLWLCLREGFRAQHSASQRALLVVATVFGLAVQTLIAGLAFGVLWLPDL